MDPEILRSVERLYRSIPPDALRLGQKVQRLAPIYQKVQEAIQIASAAYGNRVHEVEPPRRKWSVESDQNIPEEFKRSYRVYLNADPRQHRTKRFCDLLRSGSLEGLYKEFGRSYDKKRDFYTIEVNAIWQYLDLASKHHEDPRRGPVTQPLLWETICAIHRAYCRWRYGKNSPVRNPTHRQRLLKKIGLDNLPGSFPPGRPPAEY